MIALLIFMFLGTVSLIVAAIVAVIITQVLGPTSVPGYHDDDEVEF